MPKSKKREGRHAETRIDIAELLVFHDESVKLSEEEWKAFQLRLKEPPKELPGLREFLGRKSVFTETEKKD